MLSKRDIKDPSLGLAHRTRWLRSHLPPAMRTREVQCMERKFAQVGPREQQIIDLLLQGCDNSEIARDLHIAERTVKAQFNRLFLRFGIKGSIKR